MFCPQRTRVVPETLEPRSVYCSGPIYDSDGGPRRTHSRSSYRWCSSSPQPPGPLRPNPMGLGGAVVELPPRIVTRVARRNVRSRTKRNRTKVRSQFPSHPPCCCPRMGRAAWQSRPCEPSAIENSDSAFDAKAASPSTRGRRRMFRLDNGTRPAKTALTRSQSPGAERACSKSAFTWSKLCAPSCSPSSRVSPQAESGSETEVPVSRIRSFRRASLGACGTSLVVTSPCLTRLPTIQKRPCETAVCNEAPPYLARVASAEGSRLRNTASVDRWTRVGRHSHGRRRRGAAVEWALRA